MKTNTDLFEKAPVPKAVATMAVPTMISMLVVVIYNMADTFFIGQTKDPLQVAAVSLATPVFMIFMALGHLFGIGGSSAISRALGERRKDRAWHISSFCCYGSLGLGVMVAVISVLGMEQILHREALLHNAVDCLTKLRNIQVLVFFGHIASRQNRCDGRRVGTRTSNHRRSGQDAQHHSDRQQHCEFVSLFPDDNPDPARVWQCGGWRSHRRADAADPGIR